MIEDYYHTLNILGKNKENKGTGTITAFQQIGTCQGVVNQKQGVVMENGKSVQRTVYNGYTEINTSIVSGIRLQDTLDNKIYRVKGNPKNTMNMNHHYKLNLEYYSEDNQP